MRGIKCILVENDSQCLNTIVDYINQKDTLRLKATFNNKIEARAFLKSNEIDLLIQDTSIPYLSGIEMESLMDNKPQVIFTTAYSEHGLEQFEHNVIDFLVKPIRLERFKQSINKTIRVMTNIIAEERPPLVLKDGTHTLQVDVNQILYVEAMQNYIRIFTETKNHTILMTLKDLKSKLEPSSFYQTHRSYIVQMDKIDRVEGDMLLVNKYKVPVSKRTKSAFLQTFRSRI
ncbi:LytTR family DNA-binding domain-containing protein [Saprospiraceae bacterium]|nr:LytTR family DNA-binding domain-containing protein [Saprospiraceae bacterium]